MIQSMYKSYFRNSLVRGTINTLVLKPQAHISFLYEFTFPLSSPCAICNFKFNSDEIYYFIFNFDVTIHENK